MKETGLRKLDLTKIEDVEEFSKYFNMYIPHTELPKYIIEEIKREERRHKKLGKIEGEMFAVTFGIIIRFMSEITGCYDFLALQLVDYYKK